ncbi:MAG TPA: Xaa-Pro peptidase family protein [bacterium]|nr:Xaa-Pro peptidase family protein [bacterium]
MKREPQEVVRVDLAGRLDRVRRLMGERRMDLLAVAPGDDLRYLLGYSPHADERPCYLLVTGAGAAFVVPGLNAAQAEQHVRAPMFAYTDAEGPAKALAAARARLGDPSPRRLGVDDAMRADFVLTLQAAYPDVRFVLGSEVLAPVRMRKDADEIEALERSAKHADQAVRDVWAACRAGVSELELAEVAAASFRRSGSQEVLFTVIASGPNGAFPHHTPGDRRLAAGDSAVVDIGGRLDGYASDITRVASLGAPTARYRQVHAIVDDAVRAAIDAVKPGVPLKDVDLAARGVIERGGFGPYFVHRVGHGLGISGHELPSVTHENPMAVDEGFVFSIEPGVYLPGEFGVRLEEIVYVDRAGAHRMSALPRAVHIAGV